jgi:hypothetical protein
MLGASRRCGRGSADPGAGRVVEVQKKSLGRGQALRRVEAKRVSIGKLPQARRYALVAAEAVFGGLFDLR